jgi:hypothetical protein
MAMKDKNIARELEILISHISYEDLHSEYIKSDEFNGLFYEVFEFILSAGYNLRFKSYNCDPIGVKIMCHTIRLLKYNREHLTYKTINKCLKEFRRLYESNEHESVHMKKYAELCGKCVLIEFVDRTHNALKRKLEDEIFKTYDDDYL